MNILIQIQVEVEQSESRFKKFFISFCYALDLYKIDLLPLYHNKKNKYSTKLGTLMSLIFMIGAIVFVSLMIRGYWKSGDYQNSPPDDENKIYYFNNYDVKQKRFTTNYPDLGNKVINGEEEISAYITPTMSFYFAMIPYLVESSTVGGSTVQNNVFYDDQEIMSNLFEEQTWTFNFYEQEKLLVTVNAKIDCNYDAEFLDYSALYANLFGTDQIGKEYRICQFGLLDFKDPIFLDGDGNTVTAEEYDTLTQVYLNVEDSYTIEFYPYPGTLNYNSQDYNVQIVYWSDFFNPDIKDWDSQVLYQTIEMKSGKSLQYSFYYQTLLQEFITGWFSQIYFYQDWFEIYDFNNPTLSNGAIENDADYPICVFKYLNAKQLKIQSFKKDSIAVTLSAILSIILAVKSVIDGVMKAYTQSQYEKYAKKQQLPEYLQLNQIAVTVKQETPAEQKQQDNFK
ncbi:hypothetical protein PPERSA_12206 [Pseudocohnilembus persalinus]|uniref:Transmembrane protein n=1 Tax=Pseudocohnilembus persalinus TaxID=266149 RepID=A0A0V0R8M8_PSEPJ|nr:hypothetical protein PPERSA_12206 [Pseudocohnilembus persalinus]|eukprot:KRX10855.1 hypothetical protein PPERSA_12206 [Pseudocohnilembus persalinus]